MSYKIHPMSNFGRHHVLQDIKPYQCLEELCDTDVTTSASLKELRNHYKKAHPQSSLLRKHGTYSCPLCKELLSIGTDNPFTHIGRHLEGIAFSIVNYQHEDWAFYSDVGSDITGPSQGRVGMRVNEKISNAGRFP